MVRGRGNQRDSFLRLKESSSDNLTVGEAIRRRDRAIKQSIFGVRKLHGHPVTMSEIILILEASERHQIRLKLAGTSLSIASGADKVHGEEITGTRVRAGTTPLVASEEGSTTRGVDSPAALGIPANTVAVEITAILGSQSTVQPGQEPISPARKTGDHRIRRESLQGALDAMTKTLQIGKQCAEFEPIHGGPFLSKNGMEKAHRQVPVGNLRGCYTPPQIGF
jgi:hypothetical protein